MKTAFLAILAAICFAIPAQAQCLNNLPAGARVQIIQRRALLPWNAGQDMCIQVPQQPQQVPAQQDNEFLRHLIQMRILENVEGNKHMQQLIVQHLIQQRMQPQQQPVQPQVYVIPQTQPQTLPISYAQPISSKPVYYYRR